jgi:hypothetical protein
MRVLQQGLEGDDVSAWQNFLTGQGFYKNEVDGSFGGKTKLATQDFQRAFGLGPDGIVGGSTTAKAVECGFEAYKSDEGGPTGPNWPPPPRDLKPLTSTAERQREFGAFKFTPAPTPGNPEAIRVTDNWYQANMTRVIVPQLAGGRIVGAPKDGGIVFHRRGASQLLAMFRAWNDAGLMLLVLSWAGSYAPRFIRGSRSVLSNHAFGTAFDINPEWNGLGVVPALVGNTGSVRKLAELAPQFGFYWGGHFSGRPDGMHFELAKPDLAV